MATNHLHQSEMPSYMLSMNIGSKVEYDIKPPWYLFWRKPTKATRIEWKRHMITLGEPEAKLLIDEQDLTSPLWKIVYSCVGHNDCLINQLQIEHINMPTNYIPSEYVNVE